MANFSSIRAAIKTKLQADTDLGQGQVFDYEPGIEEVEKDPFATISISDNASEFETTSENKRTYGFTVRVFVERRTSRTPQEAEDLMVAIVDRLVQAFDVDYTLGVTGVLLNKATPSSWSYVLGEKEYRMAEIQLSTLVSVDVSS